MRHRTARVAQIVVLCSLMLFTGACADSGAKDSGVVVGFLGGLTGRTSDMGVSGRDGAVLAVEERNARGGVAGQRVKLVVADDQQTDSVAREAYRTLVESGAVAVVGPMTSSVVVTIQADIEVAKVPIISPTASSSLFSGKKDLFVRVCPDTALVGSTIARAAMQMLDAKTIALVVDQSNAAYTQVTADNVRAVYESNGGRVITEVDFVSGDKSELSAVAEKVASAKPGAVVLMANALDAAILCKHLRERSPGLKILGSEWSATEDVVSYGGKAVEGVYFQNSFDRNSTEPKYVDFKERFVARFGREPSFATIHSYDAMTILLDALESGARGTALVDEIIGGAPYAGTQTDIGFDEFGDVQRRTFVSVVRDGRFIAAQE